MSTEKIKEYLENNPKKPFILCEYMHDMGNSLGGMESYIRLLDQYEDYQEASSGIISIRHCS